MFPSLARFSALVGCAALGALSGCSSILGLDEFDERPPSSSATGQGAAGSGGAAGSSSGGAGAGAMAGGGGAGGKAIACAPMGDPIDLKSSGQPLEDTMLVLRDDQIDPPPKMHVVFTDPMNPEMFVVSLDDDGNIGSEATAPFDPMTIGSARIVGGHVRIGQLAVFVETTQGGVGEVRFDTGPSGVTGRAGLYIPYASCPVGSSLQRFAARQAPDAQVHYAMTCIPQTGDQELYIGAFPDTDPVLVSAAKIHEDFAGYVYSGGHHLVIYGREANQGGYAHGSTLAELTAVTSLSAGTFRTPWAVTPGPEPGSFTLFALAGEGGLMFPLDLQAASLTGAELDALPSAFHTVGTFTGLSSIHEFGIPAMGKETILGAGKTFDVDGRGSRVRLSAFARDGSPLMLGTEVIQATSTEVFIAGGADFFDSSTALVVWIEDLDGTNHRVRARRMTCN